MKKKIGKFNISEEDKKEALVRGLRKGSREAEIEKGNRFKGGPHKNKKKYSRKKKYKEGGY
jgi:hypothetical protein